VQPTPKGWSCQGSTAPTPCHATIKSHLRSAVPAPTAKLTSEIGYPKLRISQLCLESTPIPSFERYVSSGMRGSWEFGRRRAIIVGGTPERGAVVVRLKEFLAFTRSQGYRREELLTMIESQRVAANKGNLGCLAIIRGWQVVAISCWCWTTTVRKPAKFWCCTTIRRILSLLH
jgi:hypothetical protein